MLYVRNDLFVSTVYSDAGRYVTEDIYIRDGEDASGYFS